MNIRFITVHNGHVAIHEDKLVGLNTVLTVVSEIGVEVPGALEAVPDLLELCATDVVFVNLLGHLI